MKILNLLLSTTIAGLLSTCTNQKEDPIVDILPLPYSVTTYDGAFSVKGAPFVCDAAIDQASSEVIEAFAARLSQVSGKTSTVTREENPHYSNYKAIYFIQNNDLGEEGYTIDSSWESTKIEAGTRKGWLNAIATLKQMMPVEIYGTERVPKERKDVDWRIPRVILRDFPLFSYRGMHLDCSRHFFNLDEVRRYLDVMSFYKLNHLHWHLTDDQGWRIEIKSHPELTEIGGWRNGTVIEKDWSSNDGIRHGGFYTQDEIRGVIEYADSLGITIIPEIDMPGHMQAVLAAHPELGCTGGPYEVWQRWGVSEDVLCVGKDATMALLFDIMDEVAALFPAEYIHIGGDECPKTHWKKCPKCQARIKDLGLKKDKKYSAEQKLQIYVMTTIQDFLAKRGKRVIGWDEILDGELNPETIIMSWRGVKGGINAAKRGLNAIMTPLDYLYYDYRQSEDKDSEPFAGGGINTLEHVYSYNPMEGFTPEEAEKIIGVQANLWTEYIATPEHLEYMLMPRLQALSELQWCEYDTRDFDRLKNSLSTHQFKILDYLNYNYRQLDN